MIPEMPHSDWSATQCPPVHDSMSDLHPGPPAASLTVLTGSAQPTPAVTGARQLTAPPTTLHHPYWTAQTEQVLRVACTPPSGRLMPYMHACLGTATPVPCRSLRPEPLRHMPASASAWLGCKLPTCHEVMLPRTYTLPPHTCATYTISALAVPWSSAPHMLLSSTTCCCTEPHCSCSNEPTTRDTQVTMKHLSCHQVHSSPPGNITRQHHQATSPGAIIITAPARCCSPAPAPPAP